jgi:uncharacterized protein YggE
MCIRNLLFAFVLAPVLLPGQLNLNTVTVSASPGTSPQPDEAVFSVSVTAALDQSLDDIVKALSGTGITPANLSGVQTGLPVNPLIVTLPLRTGLTWTFQLTVPLNKIKDTSTTLAALQKSLVQSKSGLSLSFAVQSSQVSAQQRQNCDLAALIADARARAQDVANAAGFTVGTVVGAAGNIANSVPGCGLTVTFGLRGQSAQLGPNALTIIASSTVRQPPDQALLLLNVSSGLASSLDDVSGALAAAGVAGATFLSVGEPAYISPVVLPDPGLLAPQPRLQWTFTMTAPLSKLKDTLGQLGIAQQNLVKRNAGLSLTYSLSGVQASPQTQPACQEAGLIADAKALAQKIAGAVGLSLGGILSIAEAPQSIALVPPVSTAVLRTGDFTGGLASFLNVPPVVSFNPVNQCAVSVQFQLI